MTNNGETPSPDEYIRRCHSTRTIQEHLSEIQKGGTQSQAISNGGYGLDYEDYFPSSLRD